MTPSTNNDEVRKLAEQCLDDLNRFCLPKGTVLSPHCRAVDLISETALDTLRTLAPQPLQDREALGKRLFELTVERGIFRASDWNHHTFREALCTAATQFAASLSQPIKEGE